LHPIPDEGVVIYWCNKMEKVFLGIITMLFINQGYADVACGPIKITHLEAQRSKVIFAIEADSWTIGPKWKLLGPQGDEVTKSFQAIAQQALATDAYIYLKFEDSHVCGENNYTDQPIMIRLLK
jgi:hypothetical protein